MRVRNIGIGPLKRKLKRYRPYSRERVLEAIDFAENYRACDGLLDRYLATTLRILAERARTQLNSETRALLAGSQNHIPGVVSETVCGVSDHFARRYRKNRRGCEGAQC